MPGSGRRAPGGAWALYLAVAVLVAWAPSARAQCTPVSAEFVLTGLSNPDGNKANHEVGVCLPQFTINVTSNCQLTMRPKYAVGAYVSMLVTGKDGNGRNNVPLASDTPSAISDAVNNKLGYYYLEPKKCPQTYAMKIKGASLLSSDVATLIRRGMEVSESVLPSVAFTSNGLTISWLTTGPQAQELTYTAIYKSGGPTTPDFSAFQGTRNQFCSLLDVNPAYDLDSNPADGVVDSSTATLVGRVPRAIPGHPGYYVCAIAPAGGFVQVKKSSGVLTPDPVRYQYVADSPNTYLACGAGGYLYKLGAINAAGDSTTDFCTQCPRGSYASSAASLCIACGVNNYQDRPGQRSCKPCQFGYAPFAGASRCMGCYYGRPYCSEGYTPNDALFTCNSARLPDGYSPEAGFSVVRPMTEPPTLGVAGKYSSMFKNCNIKGGGRSLIAFNVSAECKVDMYVLGDLGRGGSGCSQNAETNSITAYYTAPNMLAGIGAGQSGAGSNGKYVVGLAGVLDGEGMNTRFFAASRGSPIPTDVAPATDIKLVLPESGWGYLGGGDNGQGQNANLKGINFDPCPAGTTKELLNGDGVEDPGEDPNKLLNSFCVPCSIGSYCPNKPDTPTAVNCPAGTYGSILGAKDQNGCVNCPIGTFQDTDGQVTCNICPPNTFASAAGATQCTACGDGYEVSASGSNFCNPCQPGFYRDSTVSDTCRECPAGTSSGEAAAQCTLCQPGTYSSSPRSGTCTECPRGSYQRSYGQKRCELCPAGTYGDSRGRSSCKVCPVGTFNAQAGSQSPTSCQRCPAGKAAPRPGSNSCSACGAGFYSDRSGMGSCRACPAGTYSSGNGAQSCTPCPKGTFSDKAASRACTQCPMGFFSATSGSARCMSCPAGAFTSQGGASSCERCQPGTYSTRSAANSEVTCAVCPPGSYSYMEGATQCMLCPAGQFASSSGATSCDVCPLGTYSSGNGSQRCLPCKDGYTTASTGSTSAGDCAVRVVLNAAPVLSR